MERRLFSPGLWVAIAFLLMVIGTKALHAQSPATSTRFNQAGDYKVVFDITSNSAVAQQQVIRDAGLIKSAHPDAQVEVVLYGQALNLIQKDKSSQAGAVQKLVAQGVSFKVCHMAMDRQHISESQLIAGVGTVPDGVYEIISKQKQGWGYIKVTP